MSQRFIVTKEHRRFTEFADTVRGFMGDVPNVETFVQVADVAPVVDDIPGPEYEDFLDSAPEGTHREELDSELDPIAINYTYPNKSCIK